MTLLDNQGVPDRKISNRTPEKQQRLTQLTSEGRCYKCSRKMDSLSSHWSHSRKCSYPWLTEKQYEVITGLLMGDGSISRTASSPRLMVVNTNIDYLRYTKKQLQFLGNPIELYKTGEELEKYHKEYGSVVNEGERQDVYRITTMCHPHLKEFAEWYSTGKKVFDEGIQLTSTILRHWYSCDGHLADGSYATFSAKNELERLPQLVEMFKEIGFDAWSRRGREIVISVEETKELLNFMEPAPPGMEYKWEVDQ